MSEIVLNYLTYNDRFLRLKKVGKNWRINLILLFIFFFGLAVLNRLFFVQIKDHKFYQAQFLGQQIGFMELEGSRGEIFFKDSLKSLAVNKDYYLVWVSPKKIENKISTTEILGNILNIPQEIIRSKMEEDGFYVVIKRRLSDLEVENLKGLNIKGVYLEKFPGRYYPQETLASHIVGFLGGDNKGQYGIEGYYDEILRGKKGFKEEKKELVLVDFKNFNISEDGSNLYLTLDYKIQFKAESLLQEAKKIFDIEGGQIIVLEPNSGRILALANFPVFNPNEYLKEKDLRIFQNGALQKIFEPGSVLKPITMAIAIDKGKVNPNTIYYDKGFVKLGTKVISNYDKRSYGEKTMTQVLEKSINTGAVFVSQQVSKDVFLEYIDRFGFTEKTNVDLQGEVFSVNKNLKTGRDINLATASFGQGIEITPLQLVRAFSVLANGGKLVRPYLVERIVKGREEIKIEPQIQKEEVISKSTASQLTAMLISVVENGFGRKAKIPGYYVAGKTGTAQVIAEGQKGYISGKTIQSFIGYAPALNPQFLILVKLDNPKAKTAEYSAAPIFQKLAKYIIDLWQIPPDYITQ